jgi:outer membrane protein assembly factor BamA
LTYSPWIGVGSDRGAFIGAGTTLYNYGFRQNPYAFRLDLRGGYGTGAGAFAGEILGDLRRENSATHFLFRGYASGADVRRFFGFGNETLSPGSNTFFKVYQQEYQLSTALGWSIGRYLTAQLGPVFKYSSTEFSRGGLIRELRPYGSGKFGELGAELGLNFDSRDTAAAPTRGAHIAVQGHVYPSVWDVTSTFGEVHGEAATYLTAPISLRPTLALQVGGKRVWGSFPFQEAAFIGGHGTVRGLYSYRFQGNASAFGNAELRLPVSKFNFLAPGELGIFGLADIGRVWVTGEPSDTWHSAFGGGLSIAYLNRSNTVSVAVAHGDNRTALYLSTGFMF